MRRVASLAVRGSGGGGMRDGRFSAAGGRAGLAHHRRPTTPPKEPAVPSFVGNSLDVTANRAHPPTHPQVTGASRVRKIPEGARVHRSVFDRRDAGRVPYNPKNLPANPTRVD